MWVARKSTAAVSCAMYLKHKPWGWYFTLISAAHFKVKLLRFNKGAACSNQRHTHRSELWLFLSGKGNLSGLEVSRGQFALVSEHAWHQYRAATKTLVLEIQFGEKCEESDIERV